VASGGRGAANFARKIHYDFNFVNIAPIPRFAPDLGQLLKNLLGQRNIRSIKDGRYGKYDLWEIAR
jgi:hypothetical protein